MVVFLLFAGQMVFSSVVAVVVVVVVGSEGWSFRYYWGHFLTSGHLYSGTHQSNVPILKNDLCFGCDQS